MQKLTAIENADAVRFPMSHEELLEAIARANIYAGDETEVGKTWLAHLEHLLVIQRGRAELVEAIDRETKGEL